MRVSKLIKKLKKCDPDAEVWITSHDGDLSQAIECGYIEEGMVLSDDEEWGFPELTFDLEEQGYTEEDVIEAGADCIILCP